MSIGILRHIDYIREVNSMKQHFLEGFQQYLSTYRQEIASDTFLLTLIPPFYGLADDATYEEWKLSNDLRYYEASNLLYELLHNESLLPCLHEFANALLEAGYDAIPSHDFDKNTIKEQIKLIYMILTTDASNS